MSDKQQTAQAEKAGYFTCILPSVMNILSLIVIAGSVGLCVYNYMIGRSLWLDEAMLAHSISTRSIFELTSSLLEWAQSAPVLYLYIVKIITILCGNTETTLRVFSFICYLGMLFMVYKIGRDVLLLSFPSGCAAAVSCFPLMLRYANEFKPYMCDCFAVLLVAYLAFLYEQKKINHLLLAVSYAVITWLSYAACFFIAAFLFLDTLYSLARREPGQFKKMLYVACTAAFSFAVYYVYWIRDTSVALLDVWSGSNIFPLVPLNYSDLLQLKNLTVYLFGFFGKSGLVVFILAMSGMIEYAFVKKNKYVQGLFLGIFIALFASWLGKYPFVDRFFLFVYPLFIMFALLAFEWLFTSPDFKRGVIFCAASAFIFSNFPYPVTPFYFGEETNELIEYVRENIKDDEKLYVYYFSVPVFLYKNGYNEMSIERERERERERENVIMGQRYLGFKDIEEDADKIKSGGKVYALFSHVLPGARWAQVQILTEMLKSTGSFDIVMERYGTPLLYYTANQ